MYVSLVSLIKQCSLQILCWLELSFAFRLSKAWSENH
jgi:hypothetical protein